MNFKNPTQTVFYSIERAIKEYRKLSQNNIQQQVKDLTVDQCLILMIIQEEPTLTQKEIAALVFKDFASITRIINLMVKKKYLERSINENDRRRFALTVTKKGVNAIDKLTPTIQLNRKTALNGLTDGEIQQLHNILQKIITNCS